MKMIEFKDNMGVIVPVPEEQIIWRPAAYAFIVHDGKMLMEIYPPNGKYTLPGGGVEKGETYQQALKRELWEETGIDIEVGELLFHRDINFYYRPTESAWQTIALFFRAEPLDLELNSSNKEDLEGDAVWVPFEELNADNIQFCHTEVLEFLRKL